MTLLPSVPLVDSVWRRGLIKPPMPSCLKLLIILITTRNPNRVIVVSQSFQSYNLKARSVAIKMLWSIFNSVLRKKLLVHLLRYFEALKIRRSTNFSRASNAFELNPIELRSVSDTISSGSCFDLGLLFVGKVYIIVRISPSRDRVNLVYQYSLAWSNVCSSRSGAFSDTKEVGDLVHSVFLQLTTVVNTDMNNFKLLYNFECSRNVQGAGQHSLLHLCILFRTSLNRAPRILSISTSSSWTIPPVRPLWRLVVRSCSLGIFW